MDEKKRIFIAEDHAILRDGLRAMFEKDLAECEEMTLEQWRKRSRWKRLKNKLVIPPFQTAVIPGQAVPRRGTAYDISSATQLLLLMGQDTRTTVPFPCLVATEKHPPESSARSLMLSSPNPRL